MIIHLVCVYKLTDPISSFDSLVSRESDSRIANVRLSVTEIPQNSSIEPINYQAY